MKSTEITIGNKSYHVKIAYSDDEKEIGLQNINNLPDKEGMLFVWEEPEEVSIWMKDTKIPLDIIFINEDMEVISVHSGIPNSEDFMTEDNVSYVLEVNKDSGIQKGDELDFDTNTSIKSKMYVLDENGKTQMELEGGERIFSRPDTKILIKFAKKAYSSGKDSDYKALGKRVFKFLNKQDSNEPEYVESKN